MKTFAKVALSIALISVIVLSIVVASVAWFTSNPEVDANDVTMSAARTLTVTFDATEMSNYKYNGQIGNVASGEDAPYVFQAGSFRVRVDTLSANTMAAEIKVAFGAVTISHPTGTVAGVLISDLFTITADVYQADESGAYVKETLAKAQESDPTKSFFRASRGAEDAELPHYRKVIANVEIGDDGTVLDDDTPARFGVGVYELSFTYTFLSEDGYQKWSEADYSSIFGYEYADASAGAYIGVVDYTPYKAKYHYGQTLYKKEGNVYTVASDEEGAYVRAVTRYSLASEVTKYDEHGNVDPAGAYIKLGDSDDYVLFQTYNQINGFPYSNDKYMGETFTFTVACTVEEVSNEA